MDKEAQERIAKLRISMGYTIDTGELWTEIGKKTTIQALDLLAKLGYRKLPKEELSR